MTIDYTIPAIPTVYSGTRYRSRLEAKWACFFDLMKWPCVYEPADFGKWSPDFLLLHPNRPDGIYVEVKPIGCFDGATADKMAGALPIHQAFHILLVGLEPFLQCGAVEHRMNGLWENSGCNIGWSTLLWKPELDGEYWESAYIAPTSGPVGTDIFDGGYPTGMLFGEGPKADSVPPWGWQQHCEKIRSLWNDAVNTVQWHPK